MSVLSIIKGFLLKTEGSEDGIPLPQVPRTDQDGAKSLPLHLYYTTPFPASPHLLVGHGGHLGHQ